jgi:hypothetical protein
LSRGSDKAATDTQPAPTREVAQAPLTGGGAHLSQQSFVYQEPR